MKNIIIEDLERIKLLFNYDNKKTLSENINIISETSSLALELKNLLAGSAAHEVEAEINNILRKGTKLFDDAITPKELKTSTEVIDAIKAGKITQAELKKVTQGIINSTSNPNLSNKFITLLVNTNKYQDEFKNLTRAEAKSMLSSRGYTNPDAIMKIYSDNGGKFKLTLKPPTNDVSSSFKNNPGIESMTARLKSQFPEEFAIFSETFEIAKIPEKYRGDLLTKFEKVALMDATQLKIEVRNMKNALSDAQWSTLTTWMKRSPTKNWTAKGVLNTALITTAVVLGWAIIKFGDSISKNWLDSDIISDIKSLSPNKSGKSGGNGGSKKNIDDY